MSKWKIIRFFSAMLTNNEWWLCGFEFIEAEVKLESRFVVHNF
jgi:hypothetical protein